MQILKLNLKKEFVTPDQTINDFFKLNLSAVPVVENEKPIGYISLKGIFKEILPQELWKHADAISKHPGNLEITKNDFIERFKNQSVARHIIPVEATVECDDPIVKAVSQLLEHNLSIISVTENGKYVGFVYYKIIANFFYKLGNEE